ncbi:hypothetical protein M3C61_01490 [Dermacoccus abyssi]|uniref:hypothetical protein n=1 Tax=Dermacoccus abyssi TaxID=322596 RepID=UPI0021A71AA0|nr:hypothetical protein [Dermacoccus abyssi]MCT1985706.1 hypothetical protein [Dermacoccus abyssi]
MRTRVAADLARLGAPVLVGASAFAGLGAVTTGAATPASAAGACTSATSGVTVVVQFPSGSATGCAPGSPGTALQALRAAGFSTTGSTQYHDGVLCGVNGYPSSSPCRMPPHNAYWAVFSAKRGGSWVYSNLGVASLPATPGGVVGFRFGSGTAPSVPVPAAITSPKPSTTRPTTSTPKPSSPKPSSTKSTTSQPKPSSSKPSTAKPSSTKAGSTSAAPKPTPSKPSSTAGSTSSPQPTTSGSKPGQGATSTPTVKATALVTKDGKPLKVITFSDGSSTTLDANSSDAKKYKVGVKKKGATPAATKMTGTKVPQPKNTAHPSISTSGSVPGLAVPEKKSSGSNNLPGIIAGVGVLGVAAVGAGYAARRRG